MSVRFILTAILLIVILIGLIGTSCANNRLKKDPNYQKKLAERQAEERRRKAAEREMADSMNVTDDYYY